MKPEHRKIVMESKPQRADKEVISSEDLDLLMLNLKLKNETRDGVSRLQEEKHRVMSWLKEQHTRLNNGESIKLYELHSKSFVVTYQNGILIASDGEKTFNLTVGELLTDVSWDIDYELDTSSVPLGIAKQYILSRSKKRLQELLNRQLVLIELDANDDDKQKESFSAVKHRQKQGKELIAQDQGFVAEEMALNLMKKMVIDHDLPIEITEADVYDDVVNKVDYVIRRMDHKRGVEVEVTNENDPERIGVQFTLMFRKDSMLGKRKTVLEALKRGISGELEDLQDIAIVNIHPTYIKRSVNKWKKTKEPGGPDKCLEVAAKVDLVQKILENLFSEKEIDEIISRVYGVDRKKIKIRKTY